MSRKIKKHLLKQLQEVEKPIEKLYSVSDCADFWGVSSQAVRKWCRDGAVISRKVGRFVQVPESEVRRVAEKGLQL